MLHPTYLEQAESEPTSIDQLRTRLIRRQNRRRTVALWCACAVAAGVGYLAWVGLCWVTLVIGEMR